MGGAGYVGGELLRLIRTHPDFDLAAAASGTYAGKAIGHVFPHLLQAYAGAAFCAPGAWAESIAEGSDVAFFSAAPHGASAGTVAAALALAEERGFNVHVVDCSADFRYADPAAFARVYAMEHPAPRLLEEFTCAVPEHAGEIGTPHAGHPGCFATAMLLVAIPLLKSGLIDNRLYVSGITGSTGSGRTAKPGTHHPERNSNLYAYKPLDHRHAPEVEALASKACGQRANVHFVPHSGSFARGIHVTMQAGLKRGTNLDDVAEAYGSAYRASPFVHFVTGTPRLKDVVTSNHAHIGAAVDADSVSVMCVIDNLVKGAAGGAMQWMNRLWQLPEASGLLAPAPGWT